MEFWYGRTGVARVVNGVRMQVLPQFRWYFAETYDLQVADVLRREARPGAMSFSVGANLGVYPLQFAAWTAPNGRVVAFEPNPTSAGFLRRHVAMNNLTDRIDVIDRAVSDQQGEATLFAAGTDGMSRLGAPNPLLGVAATAITVETETLDEFRRRSGLKPDLVMIDVEGFEQRVLAGARSLLTAAALPTTVVEMHPNAWANAGGDDRSFKALLDGMDLVATPLSGQRDPFTDYGHVLLERRPS